MTLVDELSTYLGSANTRDQLWAGLAEHCYLALLPIVVGLVLAVGAGWLGQARRSVRGLLGVLANLVYTIPSLALFVVIPGIIGTTILDSVNVVIALSLYTAALLVRPMLDALDAVPQAVTDSATAMGYRSARRFFGVDLPLAVPALAAGVRVAAVSNISLVSVGALIGVGGLGRLFTDGFQREYYAPIVVGVVLTLLLALVVDLALVLLRRVLTPWQRQPRSRRPVDAGRHRQDAVASAAGGGGA